ncbi:MAG: hypothetical protein ACRDQA_01865 [Nocardioidaceae bacterium]
MGCNCGGKKGGAGVRATDPNVTWQVFYNGRKAGEVHEQHADAQTEFDAAKRQGQVVSLRAVRR